MKKILFLIHDLGHGGAEKVLVNLVNNMDREKFDITVLALFGGGVNEQFLHPHIHYRTVFKKAFPGNSHLMKLFSPKTLHRLFIKEKYDIEISYLEGPSARIISGCDDLDVKLVSWVHCTMHSDKEFSVGFRSFDEATKCYSAFHANVFVSREVRDSFCALSHVENAMVLYNTNQSEKILSMATESVKENTFSDDSVNFIGVGRLIEVKGFDRLARVHKRLRDEGYPIRTFILGEGEQKDKLLSLVEQEGIADSFTFLGYETNPYKFVSRADAFVCSSYSEGFSTAATEALIVGTPVVTTFVSGMKEMLGENDEWGIVTDNDEESLYKGIKRLMDDPTLLAKYKEKAALRGKTFSTENTVSAVEDMLLGL